MALEQVGACLSTSTKRRNAMTSDGNLNMQGQHSGNGAAGSHSNIEEGKQRGGGDVKTLWNGSRTGEGDRSRVEREVQGKQMS